MRKLSHALASRQVELDFLEDGRFAFLRDDHGFLDGEDMQYVVDALLRTLAAMKAEGLEQRDILDMVVASKNADYLAAKNWIVPVRHIPTASFGRLIYFIYSPSKSLIKIGHTNNLAHRTWGISRESGEERGNLKVLAVVKCLRPATVEAYVHSLLESERIKGEWFSCEPVLDFIAKYSGVVAVLP